MTQKIVRSTEMEQCISDCSECFRVCTETMLHCLAMGGEHAEKEHIKKLLECAELCKYAAALMIMDAAASRRQCEVCIEACQSCAASCESIGDNDEQMRHCAKTCHKCAESCRAMA